jgi:hypothetical protein
VASTHSSGTRFLALVISLLQAGNLTIVAVEVGGLLPPGCETGQTCAPPTPSSLPPEVIRLQLGTDGPNSGSVTLTSCPEHATIPTG